MAPNLCGHILRICIYVLCTQSTSGCDKLADNLFFRLLSQIFGHIHLLALGTMTEKDLPSVAVQFLSLLLSMTYDFQASETSIRAAMAHTAL